MNQFCIGFLLYQFPILFSSILHHSYFFRIHVQLIYHEIFPDRSVHTYTDKIVQTTGPTRTALALAEARKTNVMNTLNSISIRSTLNQLPVSQMPTSKHSMLKKLERNGLIDAINESIQTQNVQTGSVNSHTMTQSQSTPWVNSSIIAKKKEIRMRNSEFTLPECPGGKLECI